MNDVIVYSKPDNKIILKEEDIKNKIDGYKYQIFRPFMEKLEREKQNEIRRSEILRGIKDSYLKKDIEKKFGIERAMIDMKLKKEYSELNELVKTFEQNLKKDRKKNF